MEESEVRCSSGINCSKMMILLLHFPPSLFTQSCYPSLFLHGWEHYYLDSIGQVHSTVNIETWLLQCSKQANYEDGGNHMCDTDSASSGSLSPTFSDYFISLEGMEVWLKEILPIIVATIPVNKEMGICEYWEDLLFTKGIGNVIMERYLSYWKPQQMIELSEVAAHRSVNYESIISISGAIQAALKSSFKDFVLYFLKLIAIHEVTQLDQPDIHNLLLNLLKVISIPETGQQLHMELISLLNKSLVSKHTKQLRKKTARSFPLFRVIYEVMECILDEAMKVVHQSLSSVQANIYK